MIIVKIITQLKDFYHNNFNMNLWDRLPKELQNVIMEHKETIELLDIYQNFADKYDLQKSQERRISNKFITLDDILESGKKRYQVDLKVRELSEEDREIMRMLKMDEEIYKYENMHQHGEILSALLLYKPLLIEKKYQIPKEFQIFINLYGGNKLKNTNAEIIDKIDVSDETFYSSDYIDVDKCISNFKSEDYFVILDLPRRRTVDEIVINLNIESPDYGKIVFFNNDPFANENTLYVKLLANSFVEFIKGPRFSNYEFIQAE